MSTATPADILARAAFCAATAALDTLRKMQGQGSSISGIFAGRVAYEAASPILAPLLPRSALRHTIASGIAREAVAQARKAKGIQHEGQPE